MMPNDFFRFKQFTVRHDKCAMKVCTDACLFGSLLPTSSGGRGIISRVLDIGTGTGLLALMYAQKNPNAIIDAVEIDNAASKQAKENFYASPWKERLHVYNVSIQQFTSDFSTKYDLIIANPPFYENELKSEDEKRNIALHSAELSLEELISAVDKLLKDDGIFSVLLPYHRTKHFEQLAAKQNLFVKEKIFVKQTPKHSYFRSILRLAKNVEDPTESEQIIMDSENKYTTRFTELLKEYYLYL